MRRRRGSLRRTGDANGLPALIDRFADCRVLLIGEAMLDSYLEGRAERMSREAPVPIVALDRRFDAPGGGANTAANLRSLGGRVELLSVVGDDPDGERLRELLAQADVSTDLLLTVPGRATLSKNRVVAEDHMLVRFDQGHVEPLEASVEDLVIERLESRWHASDVVLVSDYGYGLLKPRVVSVLGELQARMPKIVVVDAKDLALYRHIRPTAVKPNYAEAVRLIGELPAHATAERVRQIWAGEERLLDVTGARLVAVTLDTGGAMLLERGRPAYRTYARPVAHARAAGAGDTFAAALALALAVGAATPAAAELAAAAATAVVSKRRTVTCSAFELRAMFSVSDKQVASVDDLAARVEAYRQSGRRVVFTNGVFDIIHRGHITYLNRAKALGDVLIVGVNSDESVRRLKGPERPINPLDDRLAVLAGLSCVDHLVAFDTDTPTSLIEAVKPEVYAKGGDYTRETLPEAPLVEAFGGEVQILPLVEDRSTTNLITKVRSVAARSASVAASRPVPASGVRAAKARR